MSNLLLSAYSDKNSFVLENQRKYKLVNLFANRTLNSEIKMLKTSIQHKTQFLDNYDKTQNSKNKNQTITQPYGSRIDIEIEKDKDKEKEIDKCKDKLYGFQNIKQQILKKTHITGLNLQNKGSVLKTLIFENDINKDASKINNSNIKQGICEVSKKSCDDFPNRVEVKIKINSHSNLPFVIKTSRNQNDKEYNNNKSVEKHREVEIIYDKIFGRKIKSLKVKRSSGPKKLNNNTGNENKYSYINYMIKEIKTKLSFIKGVYDYSYPLVMIEKIKCQKKLYDKYLEQYHEKLQTKIAPEEKTSSQIETEKKIKLRLNNNSKLNKPKGEKNKFGSINSESMKLFNTNSEDSNMFSKNNNFFKK